MAAGSVSHPPPHPGTAVPVLQSLPLPASPVSSSPKGFFVPDGREALLEFKRTVEPDKTLDSWQAGNECSKWLGVTCDAAGMVTKM